MNNKIKELAKSVLKILCFFSRIRLFDKVYYLQRNAYDASFVLSFIAQITQLHGSLTMR